MKGTPFLVQRACMLIALQSVRVGLEALCIGAHTKNASPIAKGAHPQHSLILDFLHAPPAQFRDTRDVSWQQTRAKHWGDARTAVSQSRTLRRNQACKQCCHLQKSK